jgi:hypothetical protein
LVQIANAGYLGQNRANANTMVWVCSSKPGA